MPAGTCLDGTFWMHARTPIGNSQDIVTVRPSATRTDRIQLVPLHGEGLANSVFPLRPDSAIVTFRQSLGGLVARRPDWWLWSELPDPYRSERERFTAVMAVDPSPDQTRVFSVQTDGTGIDVAPALSNAVRAALLTPGISAASAVEPSTNRGVVSGSIIGALYATDGTAAAAFTAGGIVQTRGGGFTNGSALANNAALGTPVSTPPPARTTAVALFSRAAGGLFILGGNDPTSGAALGDLWFQRVGGAFGRVILSRSLGDVQAATFSFADNRLWIIDHVTEDGRTKTRLLRVDPITGDAKVGGSWQTPHRGGAGLRFSIDRDGWPLLVFSRGERNTIVKLSVRHDTIRSQGVAVVPGKLVIAPVVDPRM